MENSVNDFLEACNQGDVQTIEALVHRERKKNKTVGNGDVQKEGFCQACKNGHMDVVKYMMTDLAWKEAGHSSMEMKNYREPLGLVWAMQYGHVDVVDFILTQEKNRGATWKFEGKSTECHQGWWMACFEGHVDVVRYLLTSHELKGSGQAWVDWNACKDEALRTACAYGHVELVKFLLTSQELQEAGHALHDKKNMEHIFLSACRGCQKLNQWELVHWLIMDYGIEKTKEWDTLIETYPKAKECFRVKDEFNAIKIEMQIQQERRCEVDF